MTGWNAINAKTSPSGYYIKTIEEMMFIICKNFQEHVRKNETIEMPLVVKSNIYPGKKRTYF